MINVIKILIVSLSLFVWSATAISDQGQTILQHIETKIFAKDICYRLRMTNEKDGVTKIFYVIKAYKNSEDKLRLEFEEPAIEKGRRMLNDGEDLWMYLPRSGKIIRLANKQSFMGSDASNRDILRISLSRDYDVQTVEPVTENGESLLKLSLKAKDPSIAYDRVNLFVTEKEYLPKHQEFLSLSGKILKTVIYDKMLMVDGYPFPAKMIIRNELNKNTQTVLEYSDIVKNITKPAQFFTTASLKK